MGRRLTKQQKRLLAKRQEEILAAKENHSPLLKGRILSQHGQHTTLEDEEGKIYKATFRQSLGALVCGDYVLYEFAGEEPIIITRLPRENVFSRLATYKRGSQGGKERILAANLDQIFIVLAPLPEPSPSLLDRYLIATHFLGIKTHLLLNKIDLAKEETWDFLKDYHAFNLQIFRTSIFIRETLYPLKESLQGKTSIFVGQSGVGKSSLTNALIPTLELQTQAINVSTGLGNHTTSSTTLYHLEDQDSYLIDSPGVRSFNIEHLPPEAIDKGFPEIAPLTKQCKFSNCRHLQDPDCALEEALAEHKISARRLESYLQIKQTDDLNN